MSGRGTLALVTLLLASCGQEPAAPPVGVLPPTAQVETHEVEEAEPPRPVAAQAEPATELEQAELEQAELEQAPLDAQQRHDQAVACTMQGDNACVIRLLEGHAHLTGDLGRLIEAYRARGQTAEALAHMETYVARYRSTARGRQYSQILARHR